MQLRNKQNLRAMTKQIFIYGNFDTKTIGYRENLLDYQVGDYTVVKQKNDMVYALFDLSEGEFYAFKKHFNHVCKESRGREFHQTLNLVVERMIGYSTEEEAEKLKKMELEKEDALVALLERYGF